MTKLFTRSTQLRYGVGDVVTVVVVDFVVLSTDGSGLLVLTVVFVSVFVDVAGVSFTIVVLFSVF